MDTLAVRPGIALMLFGAQSLDEGALQLEVIHFPQGYKCGFRGTSAQRQELLAVLAQNEVTPTPGYQGDPWLYFSVSATNFVEAVAEACRLTVPLVPARVSYWNYPLPESEDGATIYIDATAPPHGPELRLRNTNFHGSMQGDESRVDGIVTCLMATGLCTEVTYIEPGGCYFRAVLTDKAQNDRMSSYLTLSDAFVRHLP